MNRRLLHPFRKAIQSGLEYNYAANWGVHPACNGCGKLYPEMVFTPSIRDFCDSSYTTRCCDAGTYDWRFVVGTRKGKVNLTVRSRVAAIEKRGVWAAMGM